MPLEMAEKAAKTTTIICQQKFITNKLIVKIPCTDGPGTRLFY